VAAILHMTLFFDFGNWNRPLLFAGRGLQGIGQLVLPLLQAFIGSYATPKIELTRYKEINMCCCVTGVYVPAQDVAIVQANYLQSLFVGLFLGPILGSLLSLCADTLFKGEKSFRLGQTILPGGIQLLLAITVSLLHRSKWSCRITVCRPWTMDMAKSIAKHLPYVILGGIIQSLIFASFMSFEVLVSLFSYRYYGLYGICSLDKPDNTLII